MLVPVDGGHEKQTFKATFRVLPVDKDDGFDLSTSEGSTKFLHAAVVHMSEIAGADDQEVPYSDAVRDQLLRLPYVRAGLTRTYYTAVGKAAAGN